MASPSAVSTSVTNVARLGCLSHALTTSWREIAGVSSATSRVPPGGGSGRSAPGAPTEESWPYHLRSFGPPSMTSSISSKKPFFAWTRVSDRPRE